MTDDTGSAGISRRNVLKSGTVAAGAVTLGVAGFSGTALASDCPRTPGFWANHDWCEIQSGTNSVAENLLSCESGSPCDGGTGCTYTLAGVSRTQEEWQEFLVSAPRGDKSVILAKHVLATILNFQRRQEDDPECTDQELDLSEYGLGTMTVSEVKNAAVDWLVDSNWGSPRSQRRWVVDGTDGEALKDVLDRFNNGTLPLDCDCDGES